MAEKPRLGHDPLAWMTEEEQKKSAPAQPAVPTTNLPDSQITPEKTTVSEITDATKAVPATPELETEWPTISLPTVLTLANIITLQTQLSDYLGNRVQLSGAQVETVDTAALQLLSVFKCCADTAVRWVAPSPKLLKAAHLLGLSNHLGLPAGKKQSSKSS